ncbi:MAG: TIGR03086 family metal-binding protein [Actinoplanes sp.]
MRTIDVRSFDEQAVRVSVTVVAQISTGDLSAPTPCDQWDLRHLLAHMTAQHRGFAAAAAGRDGDRETWLPRTRTHNPIQAYAAAAESVISAFAEPGVLERGFLLPEISPHPVPAGLAIGFHLVDYVAHGWDVANTIGVPYELPEDVLAAALPIAESVPDGEARRAPDAAFAPRVPDPGEPALDRFLALLGRSAHRSVVPGR